MSFNASTKRLTDFLTTGHRVWVSGLSSESALLRDELISDPTRAAGVTFLGLQFPGIDTIDYLGVHPEARQTGFFMTPWLRKGLQEGRAELMPMDYLALAQHLQRCEPVDVAIAQLSLPDRDGWCSAGLCSDFLPLVWPRARRRVAHLNPRMPRTRGSFRVHMNELDGWVEAATPVLELHERPAGRVEAAIGAHLTDVVRDGDTLQFGIGGVPMAAATALSSHRGLKIHSGMLGPAARTLWEKGALAADAPIVTGTVLGDEAFHDFACSLDGLWLTDVRQTHAPHVIAARERFVAVNSAVEVDLFGQINAERADGVIQAGAGGLPAFALGANLSRGGRFVVCLPSIARRGTVSRIVPVLNSRALCTIPRHLADVVITEHGVAHLRGLSVHQRAEALIALADPTHQAALSDAWRALARAM
ncbi:acetyl-CoA hydrolase/transferase family protein [Variovorax sp. HW608]|uniref:acetyl-CoA hydrolase/transferase family protein n=1 Tax=Variovorax sp. HW608 TaxID=1034889 RepID=UPI00155F6815|nr:acetyl-CoA hydrolase/transferase C-terminal domain-containing protein [Variovorax sp. HW608]